MFQILLKERQPLYKESDTLCKKDCEFSEEDRRSQINLKFITWLKDKKVYIMWLRALQQSPGYFEVNVPTLFLKKFHDAGLEEAKLIDYSINYLGTAEGRQFWEDLEEKWYTTLKKI